MSESESEGIVVVLPDGSELSVERGATVEDCAYEIGPGLGRDTVAGRLDGDLVAKEEPVYNGAELEIVTEDGDEYLEVMRHSSSHALAQAVQRIYGDDVQLAIGPPTDDGFYYDFDGVDLDEGDFDAIEAEMAEIVEADYDIEREAVSVEEARERLQGQPYKLELLEELADEDEQVTFYRQDDWADLCAGPHVDSTGDIGAVKLLEIAGAYWRGDEDNPMQTRLYGTAFESEADLEAFLERRREAKKRDHRRIGREMDLFSVPDHSPGCVHYHPNGMQIRRKLEEYIREKNDELGYDEVWTPELNKAELWKPTGHYDTFTENGEMFNWEQDDTEYGLKPMNCANHAHVYDSDTHSYRDLPIRLSEFGTCYRNEQSGELSGLFRVRGFTQDDGHAFIHPDQIEAEIRGTLGVVRDIYGDFGFDISYKLETRGDDAVGSEEIWANATDALKAALESEGLEYDIEVGEAAFYGPKIGIDAHDAIGREWTVGTVQLDFNIPRRLDLTYVGEDNEEHHPVMVHRALLGTFERFMGIMIEHFKGNFPTWLAPEQVRILPISEDQLGYAHRVKNELDGFRVEVDDRDWTIGRKIRAGHDDRVPYMLIVGGDEAEAGTVSVRDRFENEADDVDPERFRDHLATEVESRTLDPDFVD
jgi:threonyl-tRNA synthetase